MSWANLHLTDKQGWAKPGRIQWDMLDHITTPCYNTPRQEYDFFIKINYFRPCDPKLAAWVRRRLTSTSLSLDTSTPASPPPLVTWSTSAEVSTREPSRSSRRSPLSLARDHSSMLGSLTNWRLSVREVSIIIFNSFFMMFFSVFHLNIMIKLWLLWQN